MLDCLREFQQQLMLDDVKDLINQELQGVNVVGFSVFAVIGRASSLGVGARCPLACFLELSA